MGWQAYNITRGDATRVYKSCSAEQIRRFLCCLSISSGDPLAMTVQGRVFRETCHNLDASRQQLRSGSASEAQKQTKLMNDRSVFACS